MNIGRATISAFVVALATQAQAVEIADQRAMYEITLARAAAASSVQGASGQMGIEVRSTCDGVTTNQIFKSTFAGPNMKQRRSELATSSLEAADGSRFQFTQHDAVEGAPADQFKGVAVKGQATDGSVTYEDGSARSAALPRDAIFPTEHMKALLGAAEAGKTALSVVVFDGADKGKVYHATAIIGRKSVDAKGAPKGLEGRAHWPVSISYFPLSSTLPTPEYETSFDLYDNGVSTRLIIDYGEFALRGELVGVDFPKKPVCHAK